MPITFDRHKIYNRVPARNWGPVDQFTRSEDNIVSSGVSGSVVNYFRNSNNYAQSLVDKANEIIDTRRYPVRTEDDDALAYLAHEDAKDVYLGLPQRTGLVIKSDYQPSKSNNKKQQYYRFSHQTPEYWESVINDMKYSKKGFGEKKQYEDKTLRNFTASRGNDPKKGEYISIYDIWDYHWLDQKKDDVAQYIPGAKPFEIYDRIYLDDFYEVNSQPKEGDYYGGYLPEIEVTTKRKIPGINNIMGLGGKL